MSDYNVKSGENLWNIAKNNYNVKSNAEIQEVVTLISDENNLENPNTIYIGITLKLPENDSFVKTTQATQGSQAVGEKTKADELQEWNTYDNALKYVDGEEVPEFQMFDAKGQGMSEQEYFEALADFSKTVVKKYDANSDGLLDESEFEMLATEGLGVEKYSQHITRKEVEYLANSYPDLFNIDEEVISQTAKMTAESMPAENKKVFDSLQLDDDETTISSSELAAQFFYGDYNQQTGKYDGNIDFASYNTYSDVHTDKKKIYYDYMKSFE